MPSGTKLPTGSFVAMLPTQGGQVMRPVTNLSTASRLAAPNNVTIVRPQANTVGNAAGMRTSVPGTKPSVLANQLAKNVSLGGGGGNIFFFVMNVEILQAKFFISKEI